MNGTWIMKAPPRPEKPQVRLIPANQIGYLNAVLLFQAASGLGLYDSKQLIDINFPRSRIQQSDTLDLVSFRDFLRTWREANLRRFV
jgi:hypothetical protein